MPLPHLFLVSLMHVGDDVIVGDGCAGNLCDVVLDLVANVGHFFGVLILVASCRAAAAVLDVRVVHLDLLSSKWCLARS